MSCSRSFRSDRSMSLGDSRPCGVQVGVLVMCVKNYFREFTGTEWCGWQACVRVLDFKFWTVKSLRSVHDTVLISSTADFNGFWLVFWVSFVTCMWRYVYSQISCAFCWSPAFEMGSWVSKALREGGRRQSGMGEMCAASWKGIISLKLKTYYSVPRA